MNRKLFWIFIFLICLIPSIYLSYLKETDAFLFSALSKAGNGVNMGELMQVTEEQPSYPIELFAVASIAGIDPLQMGHSPIGCLIFPFCVFAVTRRLVGSNLFPTLLLVYFAFDFSIFRGYFSVFAYAWTFPLFFVFLLLYIQYSSSEKRNIKYITLILVIFTSIVFLHPTYVFWAISFAIGINIFMSLSKTLHFKKVNFTPTPFLAVLLIVVYFGFNQLTFGVYLNKALLIEPEAISDQFVTLIRSFLGLSTELPEPYQISASVPTTMIGYAVFARTAVILLCLIGGIAIWFRRYHGKITASFDNSMILMFSLLFVGVMHTVGYAFYGHASLRAIGLVFPIVVLLLLTKLDTKRLLRIFMALILVLAISQTLSYAASDPPVSNLDIQSKPYCDWIMGHTDRTVQILSDFDTSQVSSYHFNSQNRDFVPRYYDSDLYGALVKGEEGIGSIEFIAFNWETTQTTSLGWVIYEPVSKYFDQLSDNKYLDSIYDDGEITVMKNTQVL